MDEISGDQEEEIPQEVEVVNGLLKQAFGESIQGGNFRKRSKRGLGIGYAEISDLGIVLGSGNKEFGYFEKPEGVDQCDGSFLVIYGGISISIIRRSDVNEYERLYERKFGREASVKFERRR
jgi:hypothetical protein